MTNTNYMLHILIGGSSPVESHSQTVMHLRADKDYMAVLEQSNITAPDLKTKTLVIVQENSIEALQVYVALCGVAARLLDCATQKSLHHPSTTLTPSAPITPVQPIGDTTVLVGDKSDLSISFDDMLDAEQIAQIISAKKVVLLVGSNTDYATDTEKYDKIVGAILTIASMRTRECYPSIATVDATNSSLVQSVLSGDMSNVVDLEEVRKAGAALRRAKRVDDRSEVASPIDLSTRQRYLMQAASVSVEETLMRLDSHVNADTGFWRCSRPNRHRNGDANPSSHVEDNKVRCYRCDKEPLDSLRLVMDTLNITPDEAANWLLAAN